LDELRPRLDPKAAMRTVQAALADAAAMSVAVCGTIMLEQCGGVLNFPPVILAMDSLGDARRRRAALRSGIS
jgi:hypothetical protein